MQRAFTLIEALVAITILVIGVLGPLTIAGRGISEGFFARNQIAANYLAQEALELILNKRLTNLWEGKDVWWGLSDFMDRNAFGIDPSDATLTTCDDTTGNCFLVFDKSVGYYKSAGGVGAENRVGPVFERTILLKAVQGEIITGPGGGDPALTVGGVRVTVSVSWHNFSLKRELKLIGNLYRH